MRLPVFNSWITGGRVRNLTLQPLHFNGSGGEDDGSFAGGGDFGALVFRPDIQVDEMLAVLLVFLSNFTFNELNIAVDIEASVFAIE